MSIGVTALYLQALPLCMYRAYPAHGFASLSRPHNPHPRLVYGHLAAMRNPMTDENGSTRRMLDWPAELIDLDKVDKPSWSRWRVGGGNFSLVQDGNESAAISTAFERCFERSGLMCRRTDVTFKNGGEWTISSTAPGAVEVKDGGEQIAYLAKEAGEFRHRGAEVKTSGGNRLTLKKKPLRGIWIGEALTIRRGGWGAVWSLRPTSPVPLEAALLYWHVAIGDVVAPNAEYSGD